MPEARIPLANAAIMLATAPKSNSAEAAIDAALGDIEAGKGRIVPPHLQSPLFKGYKYPHNYGGYCMQDYLPEKIKDHKYYFPTSNGEEEKVQEFIKKHLNFDKK